MPTYQNERNGVALSVAMAEGAVISRADVAFLNTFEFRHPLVDTIRLVCDNQDLLATLEGNAPEDAGQEVTFTAFQLTKTRPEESDTADSPSMTLTASGVSGLLAQAFRTTRGSRDPWEVTERIYASNDTTGPAILPVNTLLIASSQITAAVASIVASFGDPANVAVPKLTFKPGGEAVPAIAGTRVLLLHGNGTNGSTSIIDSSIYARVPSNTGVTISTAQSIYGGASILAPASQSELLYASSTDFADEPPFTIEFAIRLTELPASGFSFMAKSATEYFSINPSGTLTYVNNTSITVGTLSVGTWYRVAVSCEGSGALETHVFLDGLLTASGGNTVVSGTAQPFSVVSVPGRTDIQSVRAYLEEVRYTIGAALYVANYTPTGPFPDD